MDAFVVVFTSVTKVRVEPPNHHNPLLSLLLQSTMDEASVRLLPQSESHKLLGENESPGDGDVEISQSETVLDMSTIEAAEQCVPHIGHMDKEECVAHISTLHDDVEKMFVKAPRFDVTSLSSDPVISDPRGFGEEDFRSMFNYCSTLSCSPESLKNTYISTTRWLGIKIATDCRLTVLCVFCM